MAGSGRPKGSHDVAPMIRGAFKRAVLRLEQKGKPISDLIMECLENDTLNTLRAMSAYIPKEVDITERKIVSIDDLTDDEIDTLIAATAAVTGDRASEKEAAAGTEGGGKKPPSSVH